MRMIIFLSSFLLFGCNSCKDSNFPDRFYDIQMDNKSNDTIKVYLALEREFIYPDTLIETITPATGFRTIDPNQSTYFDSRIKWEEIFNKHLPSDTLSIFIFNKDTIISYDWDTIRSQYKVLQRYDLSMENLKELDFKVPYPPNQWMLDNVKMYP